MRPPFADDRSLRERARQKSDSGETKLVHWWCRKWNIPPTHDLVKRQTVRGMLEEFYGDLYEEKVDLERRMPGMDDKEANKARERIQVLNTILSDKEAGQDPLIDEWEMEFAAGRMPDLDKVVSTEEG